MKASCLIRLLLLIWWSKKKNSENSSIGRYINELMISKQVNYFVGSFELQDVIYHSYLFKRKNTSSKSNLHNAVNNTAEPNRQC